MYVSIAPIAHRRGAANNVLKRVSGWVVSGFTFHPETSIRFVHHNFVPSSILLLSCNDGSPPFQFRISVWKEQPIFSSLSLFFLLSLPSSPFFTRRSRGMHVWNVNERIIAENGSRTAVLIARFVSQCSRCHGDRVRTHIRP